MFKYENKHNFEKVVVFLKLVLSDYDFTLNNVIPWVTAAAPCQSMAAEQVSSRVAEFLSEDERGRSSRSSRAESIGRGASHSSPGFQALTY